VEGGLGLGLCVRVCVCVCERERIFNLLNRKVVVGGLRGYERVCVSTEICVKRERERKGGESE